MNTNVRRLARAAVVAMSVPAVVVVGAASAQAKLVVPTLTATPPLAAPQMTLSIIEVHGVGFHVCGFGSTPGVADYDLGITGTRADGSVINLSASHTGTSWTTGNCLDVTENLTISGEFNVTYTISATAASRAAVALGGGTWDLGHEQSWDTA